MKQERQRSHSDSNEVLYTNRNSVIVHTRQNTARPSSSSSLDGLMLLAQQAELAQGTRKMIDSTSLAAETSRLQLNNLRQHRFDKTNNFIKARTGKGFDWNDYSRRSNVSSRLLQRSLSDNSVRNRSLITPNNTSERLQRPNDFLPFLHHEFATSALLPSPNRAIQWTNWDCFTSKLQTNKIGNSPLDDEVKKVSSHDSGISLTSGSREDLPASELEHKNLEKSTNIPNVSSHASEDEFLSKSLNSVFASPPYQCQTTTPFSTWSSLLLDDTSANNNKTQKYNSYGGICEPLWSGNGSFEGHTSYPKHEMAQVASCGAIYNNNHDVLQTKQNNQVVLKFWKNSINDSQSPVVENKSEIYGLPTTNRNLNLPNELCQLSTHWPLRVSTKEHPICKADGLSFDPNIKQSSSTNSGETDEGTMYGMANNLRNRLKRESISRENDRNSNSDDENLNSSIDNDSIQDGFGEEESTKHSKYYCEFCKKSYNNNETFTRHMMTHNGRRTHRCDHCSRSFYDEGSFTRHCRSHTGEKAHKCTHCSMAFGKRSALKVHLRTHTGERPYECQHCGKGFSISGNLHRHLLIHSGLRPYKCGKCPKAFNNPSHLARHISSIHTNEKGEDSL